MDLKAVAERIAGAVVGGGLGALVAFATWRWWGHEPRALLIGGGIGAVLGLAFGDRAIGWLWTFLDWER